MDLYAIFQKLLIILTKPLNGALVCSPRCDRYGNSVPDNVYHWMQHLSHVIEDLHVIKPLCVSKRLSLDTYMFINNS